MVQGCNRRDLLYREGKVNEVIDGYIKYTILRYDTMLKTSIIMIACANTKGGDLHMTVVIGAGFRKGFRGPGLHKIKVPA